MTRENEDDDIAVLDDPGVLQVTDELAPILALGLDHDELISSVVAVLSKTHDSVTSAEDGFRYDQWWNPETGRWETVCIRESQVLVLDTTDTNAVVIAVASKVFLD